MYLLVLIIPISPSDRNGDLLAVDGIGACTNRPGAGKVGVGAGHDCFIAGVAACGKGIVSVAVGKIPKFFNFFLRQIQCLGAHAAVGTAKQHFALQLGQTEYTHPQH